MTAIKEMEKFEVLFGAGKNEERLLCKQGK